MSSKIETFFASLSDLEVAKTLITEDCQFFPVRDEHYSEVPIYGARRGRDGLEDFVQSLRNAFDTQSFHVDHVMETETEGAGFGRFEHRVKTTGKMFRSHWALQCAFEDGKMSVYRFYEDSAALEESLGVQTRCIETV